MKPIKFKLVAMGLLGLLFCLPASAKNEATYTPDGILEIPHLNLTDAAGNPIASYEVTMQKESDRWRFGLATATDLPFSIPDSGDGSILTSSGRLFIPHARLLNASGQVIRNYAVYLRRDSHWRFTIYGLTDLDAPADNTSTNSSDTNATANATADVEGVWDFSFAPAYDKTFTGTEFGRTTNLSPVSAMTVTLTLEQTDEDVTGTGTSDSVEYTVSGQVSGNLFSFSMLAGYTNLDMGLLSAHVVVDDVGNMNGDYYSTKTNGITSIEFGAATSVKQ